MLEFNDFTMLWQQNKVNSLLKAAAKNEFLIKVWQMSGEFMWNPHQITDILGIEEPHFSKYLSEPQKYPPLKIDFL